MAHYMCVPAKDHVSPLRSANIINNTTPTTTDTDGLEKLLASRAELTDDFGRPPTKHPTATVHHNTQEPAALSMASGGPALGTTAPSPHPPASSPPPKPPAELP